MVVEVHHHHNNNSNRKISISRVPQVEAEAEVV
jgi:hypothetical protein